MVPTVDWADELKGYEGAIPPQILPTSALANLAESLAGCFKAINIKKGGPRSRPGRGHTQHRQCGQL